MLIRPQENSLTVPIRITQAAPILPADRLATHIISVVLALLGTLLLIPVLCTIALAIKLDDGGSILFSQLRAGRDLRLFSLFKFRTMIVGSQQGGSLTAPDDSRITRIGRILRRYKLDELPQLINVLRGEMQLVGPRPEVQRYVEMFGSEYSILLKEPPGLTDPASIAYFHESAHLSGADLERHYVSEILPNKLRLSLAYRARRTFLSDFWVVLQTLACLFRQAHI